MKTRIWMSITAITLFAALAIPVRLAAQEQQQQKKEHHQYKFVDLGTFGGPNNSFTHEGRLINNEGAVAGGTDDTSKPGQLSFGDGYVGHAFQWKDGVLTDLGALPGGGSSVANALNARGWTVGISHTGAIDPVAGPDYVAVLWKDGQIINLGTLGGNFSLASDINSRGLVAGWALNAIPASFSLGFACGNGGPLPTETLASVWQDGVMQNLGTLGGPESCALYTNKRGQVTGDSYTNSTPNPGTGVPTIDPFLWEDGRMMDLGTLGGTAGFVHAINNRGQVVGQSNLGGDLTAHPFLWDRGSLTDLGTLGGSFGFASWLNDAGEIVGGANTQNDLAFLAFSWRHGVMTNLGTVDGDDCSLADYINSRGQIVGTSFPCSSFAVHAFLWEKGSMVDLNIFVPPGSNLQLTDALYINDGGEIAVNGVLPNGDLRAVLLIPCDGDNADEEDCQHGDEGGAAVTQSHPSSAGQASTAATHGNLTPETLAAIRVRLGRRFPYRGLGPVPAPTK